MNDLTLHLAKLLLSDKPTIGKFYPFHKLSFNQNKLLEIYASLSALCDKEAIKDFYLDDIAEGYSRSYNSQKRSLEHTIFMLDQHPDRVQERARNNNPYTESHEYGFRFEIKDFTALEKMVSEDNELFIADDPGFVGFGYEKQKRIVTTEIAKEYKDKEKKSVLLCVQLIQEEHNINALRTLLALDHEKELKIVDGSIQNHRLVWHDDLGYEPMCMLTTVVNRAARENNRKDVDLITLTVTDFDKLLKEQREIKSNSFSSKTTQKDIAEMKEAVEVTDNFRVLYIGEDTGLSPRHGRICKILKEAKGRRKTVQQIYDEIVEGKKNTDLQAVKGYLSELRAKLRELHGEDIIHMDERGNYYFEIRNVPVLEMNY